MKKQIKDLKITGINILKNHIEIGWASNIGFGVYTISCSDGETIMGDSEGLDSNKDKRFIKKLMKELIKNIDIIE